MIEALEKYGFKFRSTCNCMGPKTYKYKFEDFVIYWNKSGKKFRLKQLNKFITTLKPESEIEQVLEQFLPQTNAV